MQTRKKIQKTIKKKEKYQENLRIWDLGPGDPPITPKTPIWPKPAIALFARFRTCAYYSDLFSDFGGQKRGLLHLHFLGFWGGRRGGRGGWGGPRGHFWELGFSFRFSLEIFPHVWMFGIHPQNNQNKKNKVYITNTINNQSH